MLTMSNKGYIIPSDADILRLGKHSPKWLQECNYIKWWFNEIIKILNSLTIISNYITTYNISKSELVFVHLII